MEDSRYTSQVNSTGEPPPRREAQRNRVASIAHPSQGMAVAQLQAIEERLRYRFQSTEVTERCTLLAARIFKATGAAGLAEGLPFGGILADLMAGRQHISNQYEHVGSSWGGVMFGLENKDLML